MLLGFEFPAQGQLSGICSGRTELYLFPQTALLSRWDTTAEVHPEWFSVCASCKVTILRFREDKQETGWFLGAGHLTGIPLDFKGPQLHLSLFSRWNKAILVSCLSHFSSWTGVHTWPFLEPVSASCLSSLSPAAPLTTVAITPWQLHAVPLSFPFGTGPLTWEIHGLAVNLPELLKSLSNYSFATNGKIRLLPTAGRDGHRAEGLFWTFTLVRMKRISDGNNEDKGYWI